jgi:hypothetical protein
MAKRKRIQGQTTIYTKHYTENNSVSHRIAPVTNPVINHE